MLIDALSAVLFQNWGFRAGRRNLTVQLCGGTVPDFLKSLTLPAITNARATGDYDGEVPYSGINGFRNFVAADNGGRCLPGVLGAAIPAGRVRTALTSGHVGVLCWMGGYLVAALSFAFALSLCHRYYPLVNSVCVCVWGGGRQMYRRLRSFFSSCDCMLYCRF